MDDAVPAPGDPSSALLAPTAPPASPAPTAWPVASAADEYGMRLALDQAHNAWLVGEVPVGAVIVRPARSGEAGVQVVATGYNRPVTTHDPTAHAEIVALRHATTLLENYRLPECELYVTLEPCPMCAAVISFARIRRLYYAASDPKGGGVEHGPRVFSHATCHHKPELYPGLGETEAASILRTFFAARRDD